jgi:hypothetical protein
MKMQKDKNKHIIERYVIALKTKHTESYSKAM